MAKELEIPEEMMGQIAAVLQVPVENVVETLTSAMASNHNALTALKDLTIIKASGGDSDAQVLLLRLIDYQHELDIRKATSVTGHSPAATPLQSIRSAQTTVAHGTEIGAQVLVAIARNGKSESARVQAAKELLDRGGVVKSERLDVTWTASDANGSQADGAPTAGEVIRARMAKLREAQLSMDTIEAG